MGRIPQLDILRAFAIFLVILNHVFSKPEDTMFFRPIAYFIRSRLGWTGVDLFFVLSGFLIGGLLMAEIKKRGKLDVGRFLIRRGFKIWPAYLVFIFVCFAWLVVRNHQPIGPRSSELLINLVQIQNYIKGLRIYLWSLAVEEHFYILLPLLLVFVTRRGVKGVHAIPAITAFMLVACLALRIVTWMMHPKHDVFIHHSPSHLRMDSLMVGVFLAYLFHFQPARWDTFRLHRKRLLWAAAICLAPTLIFGMLSPVTGTIGFTGLAIGYACLMIAFLGTALDGKLAKPALFIAGIGSYSYSIYLWHLDLGVTPAEWVVGQLGFWGGIGAILTAILSLVFSSAAGAAMATLIERPSLAIRDRLFPRYAGPFREAQAEAVVAAPDPAPATV